MIAKSVGITLTSIVFYVILVWRVLENEKQKHVQDLKLKNCYMRCVLVEHDKMHKFCLPQIDANEPAENDSQGLVLTFG